MPQVLNPYPHLSAPLPPPPPPPPPHPRRCDTLDMVQSSRCPDEALETSGGAVADCRPYQAIYRTEKSCTDGTTDGLLVVDCLSSHQYASASQGRICSGNCSCRHTEIEMTYQTFFLTQSQCTRTGPTSPRAEPFIPGAWQGSHLSANFEVNGMTQHAKFSRKPDSNPGSSALEVDTSTTRPTRRSLGASLPHAWPYTVSARTVRPSFNIL